MASTRPNIVKPETGHPAFDKACHLLGIEMRRAPVDPTTTLADSLTMEALIDENTIALIASAGNYGYGTIDPVEELAALAASRGIGLHVDGCLGGFILPWGEQLGYDIPPFDFRVRRRHVDLRRHAQVRLRRSRARRSSCSATERCATASTST